MRLAAIALSLLLAVASAASPAQTVTTVDKSVTLNGTSSSQKITCTAPKNGGSFTCNVPAVPVVVSGVVSGQTVAVTPAPTPTPTPSPDPTPIPAPAPAPTPIPAPTAGTTWFVRPDGGTRYSANITSGQCDGKGDAAYPGTGVNQHCAFNEFRFLYSDTSYTYGDKFPGWGWVIAGGDTVVIRGSISTGVSYRVGWNSVSSYCDAIGCWGITGSPGASGAPPPPSGTAAQHTRILGENYQACSAQSARSQLHGGWGVGAVLALNGSSYVDVNCLDITDFANCGRDTDAIACQANGATLADFANHGISLNNTSTHITLTDVRIHGLGADGLRGAPGDGFVAKDIAIVGNADAGWNADDSSGTTGVGSTLVQNFDISWNGCVEEYPIVDPLPYFSCRDQSTGGYGDGLGTASLDSPAPGWQLQLDQGKFSYNTQDGGDALHIAGPGSSVAITRVLAYGNEGQQLKVGGATATIQNSQIVANCEALTSGIPIAGRPAVTQDSLGAGCRAGNTGVLVTVSPGRTTSFQDNTLFSRGAIGLEIEYATSDTGPTNLFRYDNNVFVGFLNSGANANPTPIYSNSDLRMLSNIGSSWTHNLYFGSRGNWACPGPGETAAKCVDPGLVDESYHVVGYGNMAPAGSTSAVVGAGTPVTGISVDYSGNTRSSATPTIGAFEK